MKRTNYYIPLVKPECGSKCSKKKRSDFRKLTNCLPKIHWNVGPKMPSAECLSKAPPTFKSTSLGDA